MHKDQIVQRLLSDINKRVLIIMQDLKIERYEFTHYGGFGYCGYGSELLRLRLLEYNIDSTLLISKYFSTTNEANVAKDYLCDLILTISDSSEDINYREIKKRYVKYKELPKNMGHSVLLIGNTIFDITSGQFNLTETYSFELFKRMWKEIYIAKIDINDSYDFGIKSIKLEKKIS